MGKSGLELKTEMSTDEAILMLENLVQSMKSGKMVIEKGKDAVVITPQGTTKLEMECYQKKDKAKLAIELNWNTKPSTSDPEEAIRISSREPVPAEETEAAEEKSDSLETEETDVLAVSAFK
ncbi:conserved hypothetical protein [delta proteobacterium NaphS2]|nr:conserved hypothetical protein [delta proteobacterium NaphS2]